MRSVLLVVLAFILVSCSSSSTLPVVSEPPAASAPSDRSFSILAINDVYRIDGLASSGAGGLDRIRAIRAAIEHDQENLLFLHGGDLLYPSFMSRLFDGKQMTDILNMMDGDDGSFDDRMFVVFGNHEFDEASAADVFSLQEHIFDSQFSWLGANIEFKKTMGTTIRGDNLLAHSIVDFGNLQVGIFGLAIAVDGVEYASFDASTESLQRQAVELSRQLRNDGADFVIGLTHLAIDNDELLLALEEGPDLIIGGHEHEAIVREHDNKFIFKADADAVTATLVDVLLPADGSSPTVSHRLLRVEHVDDPAMYENLAPDPMVTERIDWWLGRTSAEFCNDIDLAIDCLEDVLAKAGDKLVAEEISIRSAETNLGNFVADLMADAGRAFGNVPDNAPIVAFVNSGGLRLNQNILKNGLVNRQHVEELIQYDGPLFLIKITADELQSALNHSASCQVSGAWLQVSGLDYTAKINHGRAADVRVDDKPLTDQTIYAVTVQYLADPDFFGNQDGYTFTSDNIVGVLKDDAGDDIMLKELIYQGIDNLEVRDGFRHMAPKVENRIRLDKSPGPGSTCGF